MDFLKKLFGKKQDRPESKGGEFLAMLTHEEKIAVSNLSPVIYAAVIGEKQGNEFNLITDDNNTKRVVPLLRKLELADLEKLLAAVEACIKADKASGQRNLTEAARFYQETITLNPYHDLAFMSYGTVLAMQGNLREGISWVEKAIKINPNNERAKRNLEGMKQDL